MPLEGRDHNHGLYSVIFPSVFQNRITLAPSLSNIPLCQSFKSSKGYTKMFVNPTFTKFRMQWQISSHYRTLTFNPLVQAKTHPQNSKHNRKPYYCYSAKSHSLTVTLNSARGVRKCLKLLSLLQKDLSQ